LFGPYANYRCGQGKWGSKIKSYRDGYSLKQSVKSLLNAPGVDLINGGGFKELKQFKNYL